MSRRVLLTPSPVTPNNYGDGSNVPTIIVDAYGRVIGASTTPVAGGPGGGSNLTPPDVVSGWTWRNQGGASAADSSAIFVGAMQVEGVTISAPTNSGDALRILEKNIPSAPYTIILGVIHNQLAPNYFRAGLVLVASGSGKCLTLDFSQVNAEVRVSFTKWDSVTSYNADYVSPRAELFGGPIRWLKLEDNNTNYIVSVSADGANWIQLYSVSRTDWQTTDKYGLFVNTNNTSFTNAASFVHLEVA